MLLLQLKDLGFLLTLQCDTASVISKLRHIASYMPRLAGGPKHKVPIVSVRKEPRHKM